MNSNTADGMSSQTPSSNEALLSDSDRRRIFASFILAGSPPVRPRGVQEGGSQHAYHQGVHNPPRRQAWNAWQALPSPRRTRRQHSRVSAVPSREGQRLRSSRSEQSGQNQGYSGSSAR